MASIKPLGDRVVIERIEEKTSSGIIIPDTAKEKPVQGKILAVGPGARDEAGKRIPLEVKVGDVVARGQDLVVLEAMKMENILYSERDAIVKEILVKKGDPVSVNQVLIKFDEIKEEAAA
jgi:co-chaperonin GroES (HSP10)